MRRKRSGERKKRNKRNKEKDKMRTVFETTPAQSKKAEEALLKDDLVGRQSIYIRNSKALGFVGDKVYIIMDGSEQAIARAKELLKDLAKEAANKEEVLATFDRIEAEAAAGMGFLLGG